jgi:hypothetical protein
MLGQGCQVRVLELGARNSLQIVIREGVLDKTSV